MDAKIDVLLSIRTRLNYNEEELGSLLFVFLSEHFKYSDVVAFTEVIRIYIILHITIFHGKLKVTDPDIAAKIRLFWESYKTDYHVKLCELFRVSTKYMTDALVQTETVFSSQVLVKRAQAILRKSLTDTSAIVLNAMAFININTPKPVLGTDSFLMECKTSCFPLFNLNGTSIVKLHQLVLDRIGFLNNLLYDEKWHTTVYELLSRSPYPPGILSKNPKACSWCWRYDTHMVWCGRSIIDKNEDAGVYPTGINMCKDCFMVMSWKSQCRSFVINKKTLMYCPLCGVSVSLKEAALHFMYDRPAISSHTGFYNDMNFVNVSHQLILFDRLVKPTQERRLDTEMRRLESIRYLPRK